MCNAYPKRYARTILRRSSKSADDRVSGPLTQYKTTLHTLAGVIRDRNDEWTVSEYLSSPQTGLELGVTSRESYQDAVFSRRQLLERGTDPIDHSSTNPGGDVASDSISTYETYSDVVDLNNPRQSRSAIESKHKISTVDKHDLDFDEEEIIFDDRVPLHPNKPKQGVASPNHPDPHHIAPSMAVIQSCMSSIKQQPGIRLFAHGTRCQPRKVWIRLDPIKDILIWRTESVSTDSPTVAQTLGQSREISLFDILYIDIGKTTSALKAIPETNVPQGLCLSILSKQGSLDLNAKTPLERDAIISCICLLLDERCSRKHGKGSQSHWRSLYKKVVDNTDKGTDVLSDASESVALSIL